MKSKLSALMICITVGVISLAGILTPDHFFSEKERRKLQQFPEFRIEHFLDHSWQEKVANYVLDQFPGRTVWIEGKKVAEWLLGKREIGNVYLASDGSLIDTFRSYPQEQFRKNTQALAAFTDTVATQYGLPVHAILVPTAAQIWRDRLPAHAPTADQHAMTAWVREQGVPLVAAMEELETHRDEALYYRTDHHFTSLGAWYCYQAWRDARGLPKATEASWTKEILCDDFYGTTYAKAGLPWTRPDCITAWYQNPNHAVTYNGIEQEYSIYHRKALSGPDPYAVFFNSNQAVSVAEGSGNSGKLLMLKDSFGNTFAQFPVEEFRQVHMIDLRFFRENLEEYICRNKITDVLIVYGLENFTRDPYFCLGLEASA